MPELVHRAGLSQDLPFPRFLEEGKEHRSAVEIGQLGAEQHRCGAVAERSDKP
jgi:hypothetical protein